MSIANKLTYLEETKGLIKEKLNDLGAEITDDTFREYVEKLEEIYRNYPKTIFRGSDITLPIAKKEKIEIFPIGNTTQDTFTGKNVFNKYGDFNYPDNSSYVNATTLLEDETIKTNANATANISRGIRLSLEANTTYVVSGKLISSTGINNNLAYIQVRGYTTGWTSLLSYQISSTGYFTFTFDSSNCTDWFLSLNTVGDVGTRYEAIFDEIQIEEGSTATSYEPYTGGIASPNPDYPQPIKNVTGNNTVKIGGKNILSDRYTDYTTDSLYGYIKLIEEFNNNYLLLSITDKDTSVDISGTYFGFTGNGKNAGNLVYWIITEGQATFGNSIRTQELKYFSYYPDTQETFNKIFSRFNIQIEVVSSNSTAATPYEPYIEPIEKELNLSGKNLVDKSKCEKGALMVDGTNNGNATFYTTDYIPVTPNSKYAFSSNYTFTGSAASYCFYDKNKNYISGEAHNNRIGYVINTPSNCYYIKDCFWVGGKLDIDSTFPQLEEGPVATEYEPYYNYELAHTYTANQDWYDYIEGSKDNWKLIKQNKRLKITGSSGFGYYTDAGTDSRLYRARYIIPDTVGPTKFGYHYTDLVKCDKFGTTKSNADITTKDIMQVAQNDGRIALFTYITKERLGITNSDTAAQKQQKYRDWFTQNQPEVIYPSTVIDEIQITESTLINQLNELYSMMTTGKTITIKTESEEENAQLNLEIRTL